jgi:hypothetical protein
MNAGAGHRYSAFALDVYWASTCAGDPALARHIEECAQCRAYLAMLGEADAVPVREAVSALRPRAMPGRRRVAASVAAGLALAAGVAVFIGARAGTPTDPGYVGVKGTPSVQLLVHHGNETKIWDGRSPVHAGDAIALRAACGDLAHASVVARDPARGAWTRLSDAPCPEGGDVLPFTLVVDGKSRNEHIAVVMSAERLPDGELERAAGDAERSARAWVVRFEIPEDL